MRLHAQNAPPTPQHTDIEDFTRFEFKYVMHNDQVQEVEPDIRHFMAADGHTDEAYEGGYLVRSLYFDTPRRENFYAKIDGIKARRKYRLRTYSMGVAPEVPIFLEEKNRINNRVFKYRTELTPNDLSTLESTDGPTALFDRYSDNPLISRFVAKLLQTNEEPVVLVQYLRRAFVSNYDIDFRVTFDSKLHTAPSQSLFGKSEANLFACVAGYTILEVKFKRRIPSWFHRLVQSYQLRRVSISKYCEGMITSGLAVDLS
tara:strand:+ start:5204 stop:5980 length:777 start_codon:yes stop_codon:yes gene_type:complete